MYRELLRFLRCPVCAAELELTPIVTESTADGEEIQDGLLVCPGAHQYPVVRGIPRMLPDSMQEFAPDFEAHFATLNGDNRSKGSQNESYDRRTRANFSAEWDHH